VGAHAEADADADTDDGEGSDPERVTTRDHSNPSMRSRRRAPAQLPHVGSYPSHRRRYAYPESRARVRRGRPLHPPATRRGSETGMKNILVMLRRKLEGVHMRYDDTPDLPKVPGYPAELNQVWTNLIDNAPRP
jgi:hypothetical protein